LYFEYEISPRGQVTDLGSGFKGKFLVASLALRGTENQKDDSIKEAATSGSSGRDGQSSSSL
jgi:hypothetical protein